MNQETNQYLRTVGIFCSSQQLADHYTGPAEEFAQMMGRNGYDLVWGGSDTGLMGNIAIAAQTNGARTIGVTVDFLEQYAFKGADEMYVTSSHGERKATMLTLSKYVVALVGGIGTLDEVTEIVELKKHRKHNKTLIVLNTMGFYDGLKLQLERMEDEGFLPVPLAGLVEFVDTPTQAIDAIRNFDND